MKVEWEKHAQCDREAIFEYLNREAGTLVATAVDERFTGMIAILKENPFAGAKVGNTEKQRKLVVPRFPFIIVYITAKASVRILRILHTSRKITGQFSQP